MKKMKLLLTFTLIPIMIFGQKPKKISSSIEAISHSEGLQYSLKNLLEIGNYNNLMFKYWVENLMEFETLSSNEKYQKYSKVISNDTVTITREAEYDKELLNTAPLRIRFNKEFDSKIFRLYKMSHKLNFRKRIDKNYGVSISSTSPETYLVHQIKDNGHFKNSEIQVTDVELAKTIVVYNDKVDYWGFHKFLRETPFMDLHKFLSYVNGLGYSYQKLDNTFVFSDYSKVLIEKKELFGVAYKEISFGSTSLSQSKRAFNHLKRDVLQHNFSYFINDMPCCIVLVDNQRYRLWFNEMKNSVLVQEI